jgi:NADH:ubiquinone oxidoreductase subunit 6 (subunit J)
MAVDAINWHTFFFLLFALITCAFAVAVVVASNIVRMAFYLIMSLGATAGVFFLAGADFVAAMQLLIYVGGTLVLLIFGVMLTAQGPFISMKTGGAMSGWPMPWG